MTTILVAEMPREGESLLHVLQRSVPLANENRQALMSAYEAFHIEKMSGLTEKYLAEPNLFVDKPKVGYFNTRCFRRAFHHLEIARGCGNAIAVRFSHEENRWDMRSIVDYHENVALYLFAASLYPRFDEANDLDSQLRTHFADSWCEGMNYMDAFLSRLTFEVSKKAQKGLVRIQAQVARIEAGIKRVEKHRERKEELWKRSERNMRKTLEGMEQVVYGSRFATDPDAKDSFLDTL